MARQIWSWIGIIILSAFIVLVAIRITRADDLFKDFAKWERVKTIYVNQTKQSPSKIIFILKNPIPSETVYAIIEINDYCIPYYILVGKDLRKFFINEPNYREVKLTKETKKKIWTFLRITCGIQAI